MAKKEPKFAVVKTQKKEGIKMMYESGKISKTRYHGFKIGDIVEATGKTWFGAIIFYNAANIIVYYQYLQEGDFDWLT